MWKHSQIFCFPGMQVKRTFCFILHKCLSQLFQGNSTDLKYLTTLSMSLNAPKSGLGLHMLIHTQCQSSKVSIMDAVMLFLPSLIHIPEQRWSQEWRISGFTLLYFHTVHFNYEHLWWYLTIISDRALVYSRGRHRQPLPSPSQLSCVQSLARSLLSLSSHFLLQ